MIVKGAANREMKFMDFNIESYCNLIQSLNYIT